MSFWGNRQAFKWFDEILPELIKEKFDSLFSKRRLDPELELYNNKDKWDPLTCFICSECDGEFYPYVALMAGRLSIFLCDNFSECSNFLCRGCYADCDGICIDCDGKHTLKRRV